MFVRELKEALKDKYATESYREEGLYLRAIREVKKNFPEACVITDVAMDPYSSDGHDGIVENGEILNDETLEVLGKMALAQAQAGADIIAPSDMMQGLPVCLSCRTRLNMPVLFMALLGML